MDAPVIGKCNVVGNHNTVDSGWAPQKPMDQFSIAGQISVAAPNALPEQNAQIAQLERLRLKLIEVREEAEKTAAALAKLTPSAGIDWTKIKIG